MVPMIGKWISFEEIRRTEKTSVFAVFSKEGCGKLGEVKWFGRWRRYAFFPEPETVFERTCLTDIVAFMDALMDQRKQGAYAR